MKRRELPTHLQRHGCVLQREGAKHTFLYNPESRRSSTVPRHTEIHDFLARKICRDLGVPDPS
ncbi:MAG: type II toxin-antitoxin system HicA family toxin [Armatimonadetes bacterium]|nr:type II toxin-antitoxin system HicA family toxin [Armatimonadota bacterium]